ncbi:MAG: hypothetical protein ACTSYA_05655 [Candidatus Kariarchaeaceae archaeon]
MAGKKKEVKKVEVVKKKEVVKVEKVVEKIVEEKSIYQVIGENSSGKTMALEIPRKGCLVRVSSKNGEALTFIPDASIKENPLGKYIG